MNVTWTPQAIARLKEIDAYISQDSPNAASDFINLLFERGDSLTKFPYSGRKVPEYDCENYRELIEGNYRIIYRVKKEVVEIETVYEARRLLTKPDK